MVEDNIGKESCVQRTEGPTLLSASNEEIENLYKESISKVQETFSKTIERYHVVVLCNHHVPINSDALDIIYYEILQLNKSEKKDILLIVSSLGGEIDSAYQISKICRKFSQNKFIVAVPRMAKSAATLLALGADEIHMGPLGNLGPIDPQVNSLPALGVSRALELVAKLSDKYPKSGEGFAKYLEETIDIEEIGYCERVVEAAAQYAERLLANKQNLPRSAEEISKALVFDYMDHGFVIELEEARVLLGAHWIKSDTPEMEFAEEYYARFSFFARSLKLVRNKFMWVVGGMNSVTVLDGPK